MPHSSGGGSHGGGSHGGSHGGYHGGSRGGSRSSFPRTSRTRFAGSTRYVYYRHNEPRYFYADSRFKPGFQWARLLLIFFYLPFFFFAFSLIKTELPIAKKNYDHTIIIKDEADVIGNETELRASLERFMEKSGVTPSVVTVYNEEWQNSGYSLETYAYNRYLQEFSDEMHWLIVYSEPRNPDPLDIDWYWEGMQGDDTDPVLREKDTERFTEKLQNLLDDKGNTKDVGEKIAYSFDYLTKTYSKSLNWEGLVPTLFVLGMLAFLCFHAYFMLGLNELKYIRAKPAPEGKTNGTDSSMSGSSFPYNAGARQSSYPTGSGHSVHSYDYTQSGYPQQQDMPDIFGMQNTANNEYSYPEPQQTVQASGSGRVICQYCGITFASKYKRCPNCNAANYHNETV